MTLHKVAVAAKDGQTVPVAIPGGIQQNDTSGAGTGPNQPLMIALDSTGAEILGTTADAKSTATDTTAVSSMSVWKQISFSIQAAAASLAGTLTVASHAVTNAGTFAVQAALNAGSNLIGKVGIVGNGGAIIDFAGQNAAAPANSVLVGAEFNTTPTTITSGNASPLQVDAAGNLLVNIKAGASSGAVAQGSTTSGQTGSLTQGAVTTAAPTYTTAQTSPISLDTSGRLRAVTGDLGAGATTANTPRVVLANDSVLASGLAIPGNSSPVVVAPQTTDVSVTPTVTASAYTAGNIMGGLMTFANIVPSVGNNGVLQSITVKFKDGAVTGNVNLHIFKDTSLAGTYADKTAGTWNSADAAKLLGSYVLSTPLSKLGAMTVYNLDGIGKAFVAAGTSLFALLTVDGTPTPASTSSLTVELAVLPG